VDSIEQVCENTMTLNEMIIFSATGDQNLVLRPADMILMLHHNYEIVDHLVFIGAVR